MSNFFGVFQLIGGIIMSVSALADVVLAVSIIISKIFGNFI